MVGIPSYYDVEDGITHVVSRSPTLSIHTTLTALGAHNSL